MISFQWWTVAKADYRMITSRFRQFRPILPFILGGGLIFWIFYLGPSLAESLLSEMDKYLFSLVAVVLVQFILFFCSLIFFVLPMMSILQDIRDHHFENLFSTPISPGNLLFGEFLGKMPFYATFAIIIGSFFTIALIPLGISVIQVLIILGIFILTFLTSTWIGNVTAVLVRSFLMKNARGRDIGKGVAFLIIIPLVVLMYAALGGYFDFLLDPEKSKWFGDLLKFFPSSWGAEIIIEFARSPGNLTGINPTTSIQVILLITFTIVVFITGIVFANRLYSLELKSFSAAKAKPDRMFYRFLSKLLGNGSFAVLVTASWKGYTRTVRNLTMLLYVIALVAAMNIFLMQPEDVESAIVSTIMITPLLAAFVAGEIGLQGKDSLLLYKHTPTTTFSFVKGKLGHYFLIILPIAVVIGGVVSLLVPNIQLHELLFNMIFQVIMATSLTLFSTGLFLRNPAFHDKAPEYMVNMQVIIFLIMIPFFFGLIVLDQFLYDTFRIIDSFYYIMGIVVIFAMTLGLIFLYIGVRHLDRLE
ncbi:hypothetical protein CEE45_16510 [Candidatus Heimdallarchaeota archaeon B3_Heim]|nr:MAG: hypothetical protein CEE45_16510 [Candidatus Heimdallarchaeota archaeon B3_Heim]